MKALTVGEHLETINLALNTTAEEMKGVKKKKSSTVHRSFAFMILFLSSVPCSLSSSTPLFWFWALVLRGSFFLHRLFHFQLVLVALRKKI